MVIVDEGWQIMPYTLPCASITCAELQRCVIGSAAVRVDSMGYKILFHKTLGVEAIPSSHKTRQRTTYDPNPLLTLVSDNEYRWGPLCRLNNDTGRAWLGGRHPGSDGVETLRAGSRHANSLQRVHFRFGQNFWNPRGTDSSGTAWSDSKYCENLHTTLNEGIQIVRPDNLTDITWVNDAVKWVNIGALKESNASITQEAK